MEMTKEELKKRNKELLEKLKNGDESVEDELMKINRGLVGCVVKKMPKPDWTFTHDDLFDVGYFGLLRAIKSFDFDKDIAFSTFAAKCIQNEILVFYNSQKRHKYVTSLDAGMAAFRGKTDEDTLTLGKFLADPNDLEEKIEAKSVADSLYQLAQLKLKPTEKRVINLRYFSGVNLTQREAAEQLGITRIYLSKLEVDAIKKLRKAYKELEEKERRGERFIMEREEIQVEDKPQETEISKIALGKRFRKKIREDENVLGFVKAITPTLLTKRQSQVMDCMYFTVPPMTAAETAEKLNVIPGTIWVLESNSIKILKQAYEKQENKKENE